MERGQTPQSTKLAETPKTTPDTTLRDDDERRGTLQRSISGCFINIKEIIARGYAFALSIPDTTAYLGREAVKFGKEKGTEVRDSVVEAGTRAWESIIDTKDRLVQRGINAGNRLVARYEQIGGAIQAKAVDLSKRAAVWGLMNIAVPIEDRLLQIFEIPANIIKWRAQRQLLRAHKCEILARECREEGERAILGLIAEWDIHQRQSFLKFTAELEKLQNKFRSEVDRMDKLRMGASREAERLEREAEIWRERVGRLFQARAALKRLQTR